jgi:uncharacterized protein YpmS
MQSNRSKKLILFVLAGLLTASLACNLPINLFQKSIANSLPTPVFPTETGDITINLTEAQLNSLVTQSLQSEPQQEITDVVVYIRSGKIQVKGNVQQNNMSLPLTINLTVAADGQGGIQYQIISANMGPFPLSQDMLDQISSQLSPVLDKQIQQAANEMYIDNIITGDGFITITGHTR